MTSGPPPSAINHDSEDGWMRTAQNKPTKPRRSRRSTGPAEQDRLTSHVEPELHRITADRAVTAIGDSSSALDGSSKAFRYGQVAPPSCTTRSDCTLSRAGANVGAQTSQGASWPIMTYPSWCWSSADAPAAMPSAVSSVDSVSAPPVAIEPSPGPAGCVRARSIILMTGHITRRRQNHHM